jgi:hypothetical protein
MSYAYQLDCHPKTERRLSYTTFLAENTGFYIKIGAYNGVDPSNTYFHAQTARRSMLPHPTDQDHCNSQPPQAKSGCHRAAKRNQEKIASLLRVEHLIGFKYCVLL